MAGEGLVDGVVHDLEDQVVNRYRPRCRRCTSRALADCFKPSRIWMLNRRRRELSGGLGGLASSVIDCFVPGETDFKTVERPGKGPAPEIRTLCVRCAWA